jgi:hypothetical protein
MVWEGTALPFHSSREVEGPALRNLGNRWKSAGANSGRSMVLLEDERRTFWAYLSFERLFFNDIAAASER